jgi:hypothetical protein
MGNLDDDSGRGPRRPARMWRLLDHVAASIGQARTMNHRSAEEISSGGTTRRRRIDADGGEDDQRPSGTAATPVRWAFGRRR